MTWLGGPLKCFSLTRKDCIVNSFVSQTGVRVYHNGVFHKDGHLPLVFVHGMWGYALMFAFWLELARMLGIQAYAIELPGHDDSGDVDGRSLHDYTKVVNQIITNEIGECILVGWSAGGLISQMIAAKNTLVKKLVLVASAAPKGVFIGWKPFLKMANPTYLWPVVSGHSLVLTPSDTRELMFNVGFGDERFGQILMQLRPESGRVAREITMGIEVGEIRCPMLIVAANEDNITARPVQNGLRKRYPHATFISFPEAAHAMMLQEGIRDQVFDTMIDWAGFEKEVPLQAA